MHGATMYTVVQYVLLYSMDNYFIELFRWLIATDKHVAGSVLFCHLHSYSFCFIKYLRKKREKTRNDDNEVVFIGGSGKWGKNRITTLKKKKKSLEYLFCFYICGFCGFVIYTINNNNTKFVCSIPVEYIVDFTHWETNTNSRLNKMWKWG